MLPATASTLLHRTHGRLLVFVNNEQVPNDAEWRGYETAFEQLGRAQSSPCLLVVTAGGTPTPKQRHRIGELAVAMRVRTAVVSDSLVARSIVTVFSWLNIEIKAFSTANLPLALEYLDLSSVEREWAFLAVKEMQAQLRIRDAGVRLQR